MTSGVRNAASMMAASAVLLFACKKADPFGWPQLQKAITAETLEQTPEWPMDGFLNLNN